MNLPLPWRGLQARPDLSELISQARRHFAPWGGRCEDVFRDEADPARFHVVLAELVVRGPKSTGHHHSDMYNILYTGHSAVDVSMALSWKSLCWLERWRAREDSNLRPAA